MTTTKLRTTRSKTGCLTCRQRKRKCDETRPICMFCNIRGLDCQWGHMKVLDVTTYQISHNKKKKRKRKQTKTRNVSHSVNTPPQLRNESTHPQPIFTTLSSPLFLFLDSPGLEYIQFFENRVADWISILPLTKIYTN